MSATVRISLLWESQTSGLIADVKGIGRFIITTPSDSRIYSLLLNGNMIATGESIDELKQEASREVWRRMIEP